jgi:PadR family transcriptional regulator AphA
MLSSMSLRIALLGLLEVKGPGSGYDLAKTFESTAHHVWAAGHTQIYPELVKMAADGLVVAEAEGARGRKTYTITPKGSDELHTWLLEHEPSFALRSESALQAFLLPVLDRDEAVTVVERIRRHYAAWLAHLERTQPPAGLNGLGRYALDLGLAQARAGLGWADDTLAKLRAG